MKINLKILDEFKTLEERSLPKLTHEEMENLSGPISMKEILEFKFF